MSKFANPHSLSRDVEITTRSEMTERAAVVQDEDSHSLKRDLDTFLHDTWADILAEARHPLKVTKLRSVRDNRKDEDNQFMFRLLSSMKQPQRISLNPKPPPPPLSREPDCEDDKAQAETRRKQALSVAMEFDSLAGTVVSTGRTDLKPVVVRAEVPLPGPLPSLLVTERVPANGTTRRVSFRGPQTHVGFAVSPHEPRPSCVVLPVVSVPDQRATRGKKRRKPVRERPPPAYWRPSPDQRGKCMGYALGYPSNWAPEWHYVRDTMKRGIESTS